MPFDLLLRQSSSTTALFKTFIQQYPLRRGMHLWFLLSSCKHCTCKQCPKFHTPCALGIVTDYLWRKLRPFLLVKLNSSKFILHVFSPLIYSFHGNSNRRRHFYVFCVKRFKLQTSTVWNTYYVHVLKPSSFVLEISTTQTNSCSVSFWSFQLYKWNRQVSSFRRFIYRNETVKGFISIHFNYTNELAQCIILEFQLHL